jgi:hypothetical protein
MVENINIEPLEITTDKNPLPNGKIHEVEKVKSDVKSDVVEVQENDEISPAQEKKPRRKRGQRGGKNIKKRVGFVEPTTDVDEEEPGDPGDRNGYVHVALPKEISKDIPVNDQGNHAIDGLVVTDRLLGTTLHSSLTYRKRQSRHFCLRRNLGRNQSCRQTHAN